MKNTMTGLKTESLAIHSKQLQETIGQIENVQRLLSLVRPIAAGHADQTVVK
jgi:hypothetical protein